MTATRTTTLTLRRRLALAPPRERAALRARVRLVVATLTEQPAPADDAAAMDRFDELLAGADPSAVWLASSVLTAALAQDDDVRALTRAIRLDGVQAAFGGRASSAAMCWLDGSRPAEVEVRVGAVLVDMEHTSRAGLATGIQRVARETVRRWTRDHDLTLVGWSQDHRALRTLSAAERTRALTGSGGAVRTADRTTLVVPWRSTYLLPELSPERARNGRIAGIARYARGRTGVIGFDCVPISTAETTALGVSEAFATNLAAVRYVDRVSAISAAAASEYAGWKRMLPSIGVTGPTISADLLPAESVDSTPAALASAAAQLVLPGMPMVLCVGTHEPRKNHVALLHAAELLWRDGVRFNLVLAGGRSWNDDRFRGALDVAHARNRPVQTITTMTDEVLWAAYRLARCTIFPSLNEGFGLPIAESLACGTPVVTSGYGSMAEVASGGGTLLVDPRDDASIAAGLRSLVVDDEVHSRLVAQARAMPVRTWDDYAQDVWATLTG